MVRPITDTLRHLEGGCFVDTASDKLAEVVRAVEATGKTGELTLKIKVRRATAGALALYGSVTARVPAEPPTEALIDNRGDVASVAGMPSGAEILAMALGFEATSDKRLRSKINLGSGGVAFEYVDDEDKDTRTKMQVFERFMLGLPVFYGSSDAYPLEARLKYRNTDGKLTFWYELVRPDRVFQQAVDFAVQRVASASGVPVLYGSPGV